jgi:tetratricopeptide (TPR) repeat protein
VPAEQLAEQTDRAGDHSIAIGRDAIGNVLVTGNNNDVRLTLVVADQRLLASLRPAADTAVENPYRGLDAFRESDAAWFFGRTKLIQRTWILFQKLQRGADPRILPIVGTSGSGKSSLVRAGLLPELARQPMEGLESPKVLVLRPGASPLRRLAEVLARLQGADGTTEEKLAAPSAGGAYDALHRIAAALPDGDRSRLVIVIDQFEEVYTECQDSGARTAFLENLALAAAAPDKIVSVILTLRNDFAGTVKSPETFAKAVRENKVFVQAMDRDELAEAITMPARALGHPWPPALVESLVAQAEGRAGALPLLEFALKRMWADNVAGRLDEANWSSRLIEDFLVQAADVLYDTTGSESERAANQAIIRVAFLAMVQLGEGVADTRRVARLSEFVPDGTDPGHVRNVLAPFTAPEARLVTASEHEGEPSYELTHEALIGSWDRLRAWLGNVPDRTESGAIRRDLRLHRRLTTGALDWKTGGGGLLQAADLKQLERYVVSRDESDYVQASKREARRRMLMAAAPIAAVVLTIFAVAARYAYAEYVTWTANNCDLMAAERDNNVGVPGVEFNRIVTAKAIPACENAVWADASNPRLMHNLGRSYDAAGKYPEAAHWYGEAIGLDWASSQNNLGVLYLYGRGVPLDFAKGVELLRTAAERGAGKEEAAQRATANYAETDFTPLFDDDAGAARASILEKALVSRGLLKAEAVQGKWNPALSAAIEAFKAGAKLPEKGITLRVLDKLGVVDELSALFKKPRQ